MSHDFEERLDELILSESTRAEFGHLSVGELDVSTRLYNVLVRWGVRSIGDLAGRTWGQFFDLRNCGILTLQELDRVISALDGKAKSGLDRVQRSDGGSTEDDLSPPWETPPPRRVTFGAPVLGPTGADRRSDAFVDILAWAYGRHGMDTMGDVLGHLVPEEGVPTEVGIALEDLREVPLSQLAQDRVVKFDVATRLETMLSRLPDVAQAVAESRWKFSPRTLEEIGLDVGLTRERVRQIAKRSFDQVMTELRSDRAVLAAAVRVRARLGAVAEIGSASAVIAQEVPRIEEREPSRRSVLEFLLLQEAGPYSIWEKDWVVTGAGQEDLAELTGALGVEPPLPVSEAYELVASMGISAAPDALFAALGLEEFAGRVVRRGLSTGRLARILMFAEGRPLDVEEIAEALDAQDRIKSLRNALLYDDDIVRVDRGSFAPAEWGLEAYTTVTDAITRALEERGGEAAIDDLVAEVASRFSVQPSSVVAYAKSAAFVSAGSGRIRLRQSDEPVDDTQGKRPLRLVPGCVRIDERWAYRITLNEKHLKGFSPGVPHEFAAHLGAEPLSTIEVGTDAGELVSVVRSALFANMGRLRLVAERLGLRAGDHLFVIAPADGKGDLSVRPLRQSDLDGCEPLDRLSFLYGSRPPFELSQVSRAVELPSDASLPELTARLRARREAEAAELLEGGPVDPDRETDDATADDLASLLGL